ncbi:MAG: hypothetical protein AB8G11_15930 [Saprospiraceae bacterium]
MKKVILSAVFAMIAIFAIAQSSTKNVQAAEILKITPEVYAQQVQADLQEVCKLKPTQAEDVYKIAKTTATKIHQLEKINIDKGNPDHELHVKKTLQYGEGYIINLLDKNQLAAYNKKDRILRKQELIRERQEMAKKAAERN